MFNNNELLSSDDYETYNLSDIMVSLCNLLKVDIETLYYYRQNICINNLFKLILMVEYGKFRANDSQCYDEEEIDLGFYETFNIEDYEKKSLAATDCNIVEKLNKQSERKKCISYIQENIDIDDEDNNQILNEILSNNVSQNSNEINKYQPAYLKKQSDANDCILIDFKNAYLSVLRKYNINCYNVLNIVNDTTISNNLYQKCNKIKIEDNIYVITTKDDYSHINSFYNNLNEAINNTQCKYKKKVLKQLIVQMTGMFLQEGRELYNPYCYHSMVMLLNKEVRTLIKELESNNANIYYVKTDGIICNNISIDKVNEILSNQFSFYKFNIMTNC